MNNIYRLILLSMCIAFSFSACNDTAPVADAGTDQNVITGSLITLDGSKSSDPDNDTLTYNWSFIAKPAGSSAALSDATIVNPSFTADVDGPYSISLVVNDGFSDSQPDTVTITAIIPGAGTAPIADAGIDQNVITGSLVTLDGSKSSDPNNDTLSYNWSFIAKPAGSSAALSDAAIVNPAFTADKDGTYSISLVVNDGYSDSQSDRVTITAAPFSLISTAFLDGETIPKKYACTMQGGNNISPQLSWNAVPENTVSLVLVVHDPEGGDWIHWLLYGISPQVTAIPEGIPEGATVDESLIYKGAKQARNTSGTIGYYGPCPPDPPHSYIFTLYALDKVIEFTSGQSLSLITNALEGHVLDQAQLVGNY